ncbi:MAG: hypothetical protein FD149_1161 [Rhodospirillaceae bacterium]|nr:MAG: hypothetical protein FD149_1161 [Rhodospirillaceae bacterium]
MWIGALFKAIVQMITDARLRRVMLRSVGLAVAVYGVAWMGVSWLLTSITWMSIGWLEILVDLLGAGAILAVSLLFFPALVSTIIGFFLEEVAEAVEARHYPDLPPVRRQPLGGMVWEGMRYAAILIALNVLVLPVYVMAPVINLVVFFVLNGYLLGREYYELVAARRLMAVEGRALWVEKRRSWWMAGGVITGMLAIPVVNVFAPLCAAAFMVHVFEGTRRRTGGWGGRALSGTKQDVPSGGTV